MIKQSIGLIETVGLSAAVEAADAAVKSANVSLVGYELTKGGGMVVVKILGDVAAVSAGIAAAQAAAARVGQVVTTKVIARPAAGIEGIVITPETVGLEGAPATSTTSQKTDEQPQIVSEECITIEDESQNLQVIPSQVDSTIAATSAVNKTSEPTNKSKKVTPKKK